MLTGRDRQRDGSRRGSNKKRQRQTDGWTLWLRADYCDAAAEMKQGRAHGCPERWRHVV